MGKPTIRLLDRTEENYGRDLPSLARLRDALQRYVDRYYQRAWGTDCVLLLEHEGTPKPTDWPLVLLDDADEADALGYHDLSADGQPLSKIFVGVTLAVGETVSGCAAHELAEILVDPFCQQCADGPVDFRKPFTRRQFWAWETCDPVQARSFDVLGLPMSDFVFPAWFSDMTPRGGRVSYLQTVRRPFELDEGGYAIVCRNGRWSNVFGSAQARKQFKKRAHARGSNYADPSAWIKSKPRTRVA